jgi:hypothetical protein
MKLMKVEVHDSSFRPIAALRETTAEERAALARVPHDE